MSEYAHLLTADPDLGSGIPVAELEHARRVLVADALRLDAGAWEPQTHCSDGSEGFALLVLRGGLTREVHLAGRRAAELVGPGDVVRPGRAAESLLPHDVTWTVTEPSIVAILDERFRQASRRWPSLAAALDERLLAQVDRLGVHVAIAQLARVDLRILALFWHLADRWGRVTPDGIALPLKLTHEAIGRLVGAQRPTVTIALAELGAGGHVTRATTGGWLLHHDSRALLESPRGGLSALPARRAVLAG
ncbi:MAG: Crp/Fnr family transcriptional regulator [Actinomycetota bacterium]|nr:Crp/Fnr family transcriptional regulator [Actinomycetota bacterium]